MRRVLAALLVAAASLALGAASARSSPHATPTSLRKRPNVVVILSDDERYDAHVRMRAVRRLLGREGVTFDRYYDVTSECCPARAGILTGQYPHHDGVLTNFGPHGYAALDESSTLATWLHSAGYETALVGKYLNGYTETGRHHIPPGWDDWVAVDSIPEERYYHYVLNVNGRLVHYGAHPWEYSTTVFTSHALGFLRTAREPFFLYLAPVSPHLPATAAPRDRGTYRNLPPLRTPSFDEANISDKPWAAWHADPLSKGGVAFELDNVRRRQLEAMLSLDRSVARVVAELRRRGTLDRTVIVYASDNGFLWGEHRLGGKIWPYEESIHLPLVIRTPWPEGDGTVADQHVLNVDLAPTIAALAGVTPSSPVDGMSMAPLLHGREVPWRVDGLVEYLGPSQLRVGGPPPFTGLRTRRFLYVEYLNGWRELYDLRADPWELRNVAGTQRYAATQRYLARRLATLRRQPARQPLRG